MKKKILIIDDKESIAKILSIYLSPDFDLVWFDNPIKGISWLQEGNIPDLIISDIKMPEMRGDEFLHYLKNNDLFKSIHIIMLSGEDSTSERIRLLSEGADDYILKPFNPMELKVRVKKIIQ
ncbi:MAG: response regulator [Bacteroidales bacterium]|nr:response regulator [Bacteroidales bacterium]